MADDLIYCPSCQFQLRLPTDLYGSEVECPQCHNRFTAPVPVARPAPVRPPPGREYDAAGHQDGGIYGDARAPDSRAIAAVRTPAIILIVLSGMAALAGAYGAATADQSVARLKELAQDPNLPPQFRDFFGKRARPLRRTW